MAVAASTVRAAGAESEIGLKETDGSLTFRHGEKVILEYHTAEVPPPEGVDKVFNRSGFIHPLCAPGGGTVTGMHPADHHHHLGIWHAWVKTKHGHDEPDFWNLGNKTGRVRFVKVLEKGPDFFKVAQEQIAYKGKARKETVVLEEVLTVKVGRVEGANVIDYDLVQQNVSGVKLELPAYRYGGPLGFRGPHDWNAENSDYLTSAGKTRKDSHQSRADWCAVYGPTSSGEATLVMMGHPSNHDAPQRLRTWPDGKVFLCWTPVQEKGFAIGAGDTVAWRYRLIVADGKPDSTKIKKWWESYRGL